MQKFKGLMTSLSCEWSTPQWLFDKLNEEFCFELDASAKAGNTKCRLYYSPSTNALCGHWALVASSIWLNPPYGREIGKWLQKAYEESLKDSTVVCLIPCRTDARWWHDYVMKADEIRFIRGRLKFGGSKNSAPFPSCVAIFGQKK